MTYYEKGEHFIQEKHSKNGFSRETLDEQHWQRGTPALLSTRSSKYSALPSERLVDDYRRTDYAYKPDDDFVVRRSPSQSRNGHYNQNDSVYSVKQASPVSRPGSPGPVAGVGDILNTEHGFTIQLDVKHFRPEEIKVVLNDDLLCVSGERIEQCGDGQTLRRSFSRKYSIPSDIQLESIRSQLTDTGLLVINGSRRGWKETNIAVHPVGNNFRRSGSVISTV